MFNKMRKKRLQKEVNLLKTQTEVLINKKNEIKTDIKKTVNNTVNNAGVGFCPYAMPNFDVEFSDEPNEPLGLKKGTIRACLTIWIVLTTCILAMFIVMSNAVPVAFRIQFFQWWLIITGLVISSYYVTRIGAGFFGRRFF